MVAAVGVVDTRAGLVAFVGVTVVFSSIGGTVGTKAGVFSSGFVLGVCVTLKISGVDGLGLSAPVVAVDFDVGIDAGGG